MPRPKLIRSDYLPYHVTGRVNHKERFPIPINLVWKILSNELFIASEVYSAKVHAFVLMPNHFHLILSTPKSNLDQIMQIFMCASTRVVLANANKEGRLYGSRYYWSLIQKDCYLFNALKYVYRNPVKAGLSSEVQNYPFSSLRFKLGLETPQFKLSPLPFTANSCLVEDHEKFLNWLNCSFSSEHEELVLKALKKKIYKYPKCKIRNRPNRFEDFY